MSDLSWKDDSAQEETKQIKKIVIFFLNYYERSRGRGHTYAMLHGALNSSSPIIIFPTRKSFDRDLIGGMNAIALDEIADDRIRGIGYDHQILFDNSAIVFMLSEMKKTILLYEKKIKSLEKEVRALDEIIQKS